MMFDTRHDALVTVIAAAASASALVGALLVSRSISLPLRALRRTAQRLADGELEARAPLGGPSELREVASVRQRDERGTRRAPARTARARGCSEPRPAHAAHQPACGRRGARGRRGGSPPPPGLAAAAGRAHDAARRGPARPLRASTPRWGCCHCWTSPRGEVEPLLNELPGGSAPRQMRARPQVRLKRECPPGLRGRFDSLPAGAGALQPRRERHSPHAAGRPRPDRRPRRPGGQRHRHGRRAATGRRRAGLRALLARRREPRRRRPASASRSRARSWIHGGTIRVADTPGGGASFTFTLPA